MPTGNAIQSAAAVNATQIGGITVTGTPAAGQVIAASSPTAAAWAYQNYGGIFGNGSDGAVTFDGIATVLGMVPAGNVYTMTRDIQCTAITINNGVTVKPTNYRIFCAGTVTNNGTISSAGNNAAGNTAGGSLLSNSTSGGRGGGNGGTGVSGAGAAGGNANYGLPGGAGGTGTSGGAGAGGTATVTTAQAQSNILITPYPLISGTAVWAANQQALQFGAGGGGGGSDASSNAGGGGGGGGGIIGIIAYAVNNGGGTMTAAGGNGANGTAGNAGGGGSGSGGAILVYTLSAWTAGTTNVAAGTHGNGVGTGANGNNGGAGLVLNVVLV